MSETWDALIIGIDIGYLGRMFSGIDIPISRYTMFALSLATSVRLKLVTDSSVVSSISTINFMMMALYWIITFTLDDPFYTDLTRPHPLDDIIVHAVIPLDLFFHSMFTLKAYKRCVFSPLIIYFTLYSPLFIITRPYPFVSTYSIAVKTLALTVIAATVVHAASHQVSKIILK